jgi:hypothetical protein
MHRVLHAVVLVTLVSGCGDDTATHNPDMTACGGGPASGAADTHCGGMYISVVQSDCSADAGADSGTTDYGATMYGTSGYDDDCKYSVSYAVDPICENSGVTFTVVAKNAVGGAPLTGAMPRVEAVLGDVHPAPNAGTTASESPPGTYKIGPVKFDQAGQWVVRFHFFETCADTSTSPHGHAAFYVNVP